MKIPAILMILLATLLASTSSLAAKIELAGIFFWDQVGQFSLVDSETGKGSRWLQIGDVFLGYTLESYDVDDGVLRLVSGEEALLLTLRKSMPLDWVPTDADAPSIVGIGASLGEHEQGAQILSLLPDHPAERANIKEGQVILRVNGAPVAGRSLREIADLIRGPAGSSVRLDMLTPGNEISQQVILSREKLVLPD